MSENFTHFNQEGRSRMVDVTKKKETDRMAVARGTIRMKKETLNAMWQAVRDH
ncbi:MAG: cyclic pyranopterin monophosphate synthase MoaC, partial [Eubacterium sp.]